jgi:hypothetical protein
MGNILGLTDQEMRDQHAEYHRQNPDAPRGRRCLQCKREADQDNEDRAVFVLTEFRQDSTYTVQQLAFAIDRRPAWVRKTLRRAGLVPVEAVRVPPLPKSQRPCTVCGHLRNCHCRGKKPRRHVQHAPHIVAWPCPLTPHCKGAVETGPEQYTNCSCSSYTTRPLGRS